MADADVLARIDARLAEGNELMRANREALDHCREALDRYFASDGGADPAPA